MFWGRTTWNELAVILMFWLLVKLRLNDFSGNSCCSEKSGLGGIAAAKIKQLTADLEAEFNPVEKIKTGFTHFKTEKYE